MLEYLPHHLIPYASSNYRQDTRISVAESSTLLAWDAYSAGRIARGERFAYTSLSSRTRISRDGVPEVADGFELLAGGEPFGGFSYLAGLYVLAARDLAPLADELHAALVSLFPRALASASAPSFGLCAVRVLARDATVLYRALNSCRALSRASLGLPPPAREVW